MSFRIMNNISAMNAHVTGIQTNRNISSSLEKLSSGIRINKSADDGSGLAIADSLRTQANTLGQAIGNANDAIGMVQTADKAMDEQIKILDRIKVKATQAAQDGQNTNTRRMIQGDIKRLLEQLDNIAETTSFNGGKLLSGSFNNKEFQIGAESNETVGFTIGSTHSDKIGLTRYETGERIKDSQEVALKFKSTTGGVDIQLETVTISSSAGTGLGVLAETINKNSAGTGIRAEATVESTSVDEIKTGDIKKLVLNGVTIGDIEDVKVGDRDGRLVATLNAVKDDTGVEAYTDAQGRLNLRSLDGRGIELTTDNEAKLEIDVRELDAGTISGIKLNGIESSTPEVTLTRDSTTGELNLDDLVDAINDAADSGVTAALNADRTAIGLTYDEGDASIEVADKIKDGAVSILLETSGGPLKEKQSFDKLTGQDNNFGRLTLVKNSASDIRILGDTTASNLAGFANNNAVAQESVNLRNIIGAFDSGIASAIGANANDVVGENNKMGIGAGVTSLDGAMLVMDIASTAIGELDKTRADIGAIQNQLIATINNISVTQVNIKAAESQIRDVDFAKESANFSKQNILAQSGSYAMSQANAVQQNVLRLLQ